MKSTTGSHFALELFYGALVALILTLLPGCDDQKVDRTQPPPPPPPTFTGPGFLHGTIGSLCRLEGYRPMYISGFGLVVGLQGTGMSNDVPSELRQRFINLLRQRGISPNRGPLYMSAEEMLASPDVAVVVVEGLVAPGAVKGTPFDLWVRALDGTQTMSLENGILWSTELGIEGANPNISFTTPLARARGPLYLDPFVEEPATQTATQPLEMQRQAAVLAGGITLFSRPVDLVLNQPSWTRSALIANRINDRFRKGLRDKEETAVAQTDTLVRVNIPSRYAQHTDLFLELVGHLFLNASPDFVNSYSQQLVKMAESDQRWCKDVALTWESMGKLSLPTVRAQYHHRLLWVRLAALEAGAKLDDEGASLSLEELARHEDPAVRRKAADLLVHLPRSMRGAQVLKKLLDDDDRSVRISAYESLSEINDPIIAEGRIVVTEDIKDPTPIGPIYVGAHDSKDPRDEVAQPKRLLKFVLDIVPAEKPLIYVSTVSLPRIVIFSPNMGIKSPSLAQLWDNRLMLRVSGADKPMNVFYQTRGQIEGQRIEIPPTVGNLALLLGRTPDPEKNIQGFSLQFGRVVNALYQLRKAGMIDAPIEFQPSPLAAAIAAARDQERKKIARPDTANMQGDTDLKTNAKSAPMPLSPENNKGTPPVNISPDGAPIIDGNRVDMNPNILQP